jgi:hypothetical protein
MNSSLCSFLQSPVTSSLFGPNILLSTLFSKTSVCVLPLLLETKFRTYAERSKHSHCEKIFFPQGYK